MPQPSQSPDADRDLPGALAAHLLAHAPEGAIVLLGESGDAGRLASLLRAFAPDAVVAHYPASDALPGAAGSASALNVGARVAALHAARVAGERPVFLVAVAEATIAAVQPPDAFDLALPCFAIGDPLDHDGFSERAERLGYVADDRVDEPGEYAVRGGVIDIYPVDKPHAVRLTLGEGAIAAIEYYDPLSQRGIEALDAIEVGRACEPEAPRTATLLDHLPGRPMFRDASFARQRERFAAFAAEQKLRVDAIDPARWAEAEQARDLLPPCDPAAPVPRFVERRDAMAAFLRHARAALKEGALLVTGSERDLRFLAPRLGKPLKQPVERLEALAPALEAGAGRLFSLPSSLDRGFAVGGLTVIAAADLLGGRARREDVAPTPAELVTITEMKIGDVVVHEDFGVGRIAGLEAIAEGEAVRLDYARENRRLVPLAEMGKLWRYGADADAVTLDALDGSSWEKRRAAIDAAIAETARGLSELAAERAGARTVPIEPDVAAFERFAGRFAFTETPDQARAIAAIRADLASGHPMDRLIVGDVGYGKTEVALRAAAMVALAGRQVALAAPTTVLVRQHLETFRRRFEGTGIEVAGLSRLDGAAEQRRVRAGLKDGSIGLVVGTSAIAAEKTRYADLGLVIVDEEQRFGARDKERLRSLGAGHALSLSATPIPRSLLGALVGLQQVSIIATPPARRQPIRTLVGPFDEATVRAALLRETSRGGQSFVVVPRIEDIAGMEARLAKLVPDLKLVVAHGKMPVAEIDAAMVGFANGEGDVLLATNIIEAGLDVPRANTMVVHRADRFGLAQLHQLRGRVGRGARRGQILLTTEAGAKIPERTMARLRTLQAFDTLGAGFAISARDLDLRGAGDLLGEEQAGHMKLIGTDLYQHLLARAIRAGRGEADDRPAPELNLGDPGHLPAEWIPDEDVRIGLYGRLARLDDDAAVNRFEEELEDRFGALPAAAARAMDAVRIRMLAESAGVARIDAGPAAIAITPVDREADWTSAGLEKRKDRWIAARAIPDEAERLAAVRETLHALPGD